MVWIEAFKVDHKADYEHVNDLELKDPQANEKPVNLTHGKLDIGIQRQGISNCHGHM